MTVLVYTVGDAKPKEDLNQNIAKEDTSWKDF